MLETIAAAWDMVSAPDVLLMAAAGLPLGLIFGVVPGLSGLTALAILMPLVYGMAPAPGLAFLVAAHAVVYTGGSVTAIILGIPGTPPNAATVADGFALSRQGRAGYAVGAALAASALGGMAGAAVLMALLPLLQPIVLAVGSPETFLLALVGILLIGSLGSDDPLKGVIAGGLGILLSCAGAERVTGVPRFWFDVDYLLDGIRLVPLALGLFAVPEIVSMMATGAAVAAKLDALALSWREAAEGARQVVARWRLTLRSALIGVGVGILPGVGGETAPFVAYAAARPLSPEGDRFGRGALDGVIAPESSNNAKEGGALVPTLAVGIPGSAGMAVLLGAFVILGLEPGPDFIGRHADVAIGLAWIVAGANVTAAALLFSLVPTFAAVTRLRGHVLAPMLLVIVVVGAYAAEGNGGDVASMLVFGVLGLAMRRFDLSRPALLLGFVLGGIVETYLHISLAAYGIGFLARPGSLVILAGAGAGLVLARRVRRRRI